MAKKVTKKAVRPTKPKGGAAAGAAKRRAAPKRAERPASARPRARATGGKSAADALVGLLESPLVAEIIAAGAAAALAAMTQQALSKRGGGTKTALKEAAKAAANAMGARLTLEFDEIIKTGKKAGSESR